MISKTAVVETTTIGSGTKIGEFAVVRMGVRLGERRHYPPPRGN